MRCASSLRDAGRRPFCAYNTGAAGKIVEKCDHSTSQWFQEKGRHPIFAAGKHVPLGPSEAPTRVVEPTFTSGAAGPFIASSQVGIPGRPPAMEPAGARQEAGCGTGCGCH
jgi:hypothetical protein